LTFATSAGSMKAEDRVMNEPTVDPWLSQKFIENQLKFPREQLTPYRGQYVAWNWEGDQIVGHAATREALWQQLEAAGVDAGRAPIEFVEDL
jgi:hypothetical protein